MTISGAVYREGVAYSPDGAMYVTQASGSSIANPTFTGVSGFAAGTSGAPSIYMSTDTTTGWYRNAANQWTWVGSTVPYVSLIATLVRVGSGVTLAWTSGDSTASADSGISRVSAGLVGVGTGAQGSVAGSLRASTYATSAPVTETTATHTVAATTSHLICNRAGDITVTLPTASSFPGRILWIRTIQAQTVTSNASNVVPRTGGAAGTAILAATDGAWTMLVSDGTNWESMAGTP